MSSSITTTTPTILPRDARLIALLLAANGAEDSEEGVVRMLVEFAHRYTTDILNDSLVYAEHARNGLPTSSGAAAAAIASQPLIPSLDDIRLAVQARTEGSSVSKEFLLQLATTVNASPLSAIPEVYGIRLPPKASRLTAPNFSLTPKVNVPTPLENNTRNNSIGNLDAEGESMDEEEEDGNGNGLFGDDDEEEEEEDQDGEGEDDEEDDDDEEMEDVTMGGSGNGFMDSNSGNGENGTKRKAENGSDDEYD